MLEGLREKVGRSEINEGRLTIAVNLGFAHQRTIDDYKVRNQLSLSDQRQGTNSKEKGTFLFKTINDGSVVRQACAFTRHF